MTEKYELIGFKEPISSEADGVLSMFVSLIQQEYKLKNGRTALYHHLRSTVEQHMFLDD